MRLFGHRAIIGSSSRAGTAIALGVAPPGLIIIVAVRRVGDGPFRLRH